MKIFEDEIDYLKGCIEEHQSRDALQQMEIERLQAKVQTQGVEIALAEAEIERLKGLGGPTPREENRNE